jgi:hypothetical protein
MEWMLDNNGFVFSDNRKSFHITLVQPMWKCTLCVGWQSTDHDWFWQSTTWGGHRVKQMMPYILLVHCTSNHQWWTY